MKKLSSILLAATSAVALTTVPVSTSVLASEVTKASSEKQASAAIKFRKSLFQLVYSNMGPLGAMAKGNIPMDADVIAKNAQRIEFLGTMMNDYFALDTSAFSVETEAKDIIWKEHADFTDKINGMVTAAADLQELVANNQESDFRKGIGAVGASCKACHDKFKED
jgi:cytochrome c556